MSKYQALIDAPSLHEQIMNLPCVQVNMEPRGSMARLAYKVGHRDARHAAAELAQAQDATIRALLADLERAEKALKVLLASGGVIAEATDQELEAAIQDPGAEEIVQAQAAAVLNARAALAQMAGG